jgi:ADP-ribose pyrophosphatase YjhB (NUDIX family)
VLQREPRYDQTWFLVGSILPKKEHVDVTVRELFEEMDLTMTVVDLTMLSNNSLRAPLPAGKHQSHV